MNPQPKTVAHRNADLLAMAEGKPCMLLAVEACQTTRGETTVACHGNWSKYGKAGARKADDQYVVFGCGPCHDWLDKSGAPKAEKMRVFEAALLRQIELLAKIVFECEIEKERKAARWALELLTPEVVGAMKSGAGER